jgi:hypothetical protein
MGQMALPAAGPHTHCGSRELWICSGVWVYVLSQEASGAPQAGQQTPAAETQTPAWTLTVAYAPVAPAAGRNRSR